jgi:restriction endonuclease S subunit
VQRGEIRERADVNYSRSTQLVKARFANARFPVVSLRELIIRAQYGISELATSEEGGLRMLRMINLQAEGWDFSSLKYIDLPPTEAARYLLEPGDILFNRTNSKELVGKCEVFIEAGAWVFASYLIRVSLDAAKVLPDFVSLFLNTATGRAQIDRVSRQIVGMSNVNAEELQDLILPLPSLSIQRKLVAEMQAAREARQQKQREADKLANLDAYLLECLGLNAAVVEEREVFAVKLRQVKGRRFDPPAYRPYFVKDKPLKTTPKPLAEIALIDPHSLPKPRDPETLVPYVGLPECDLTAVREVAMRPYREVKGRSIVKPGDILFARIEPSVFNQKYVLADDLKGHAYAYTSTEFYVVKPRESVNLHYLYAMFFCSFVFAQTKGKTTGSSGRRRLDPEMFASLQIPVPEMSVQKQIAAEVRRRREQARRLRLEAEADWSAAKRRFEAQLLGT